MKKDRAYLFKGGKQCLPLNDYNFNKIYGHLSADELLMKYNTHHPKPVNEDSEQLKRMFRKFD